MCGDYNLRREKRYVEVDAGDFPVILTNTGALHPEYGLFAPSNGPLPQGNV